MARPKKPIDAGAVFELAKIGATTEEMGSVLGCNATTIARRFGGEIERGRAEMKVSLRRQQLMVASEGNATMLIWLGKQLLGQSDKSRTELAGAVDTAIIASLSKLSVEEQNGRLLQLLANAGFHLEAASRRAEGSPTPDGLPTQAET